MTTIAALFLFSFTTPVTGADAAASARDLPFKQVAAPAEDIVSGRVRLPDPAACATNSPASMIPVEFEWRRDGGWVFETAVSVASAGRTSLGFLALDSAQWDVSVRVESGDFAPIGRAFAPRDVEHRSESESPELVGWTCDRYDVENAPAGTWTVRVAVSNASASAKPTSGWLFARDSNPIAVAAHTSTLATLSENEIGVVARLFDSAQFAAQTSTQDLAGSEFALAPALKGIARSGEVVIESSDGHSNGRGVRYALFDDGLHDDGAAQDGVFGAKLPRWMSGEVIARVELRGVTTSGAPITRTARLAFPVLEKRTAFSGTVVTHVEDATRLCIELGALQLGPEAQLHVSAEVWGTNAAGELVPVCWLSRMLFPEERGGEWKLPLFLDGRWIDVAHAHAPFALRNVRVQDPDTHVPYDTIDWMPLTIVAFPPIVGQGTSVVTPSMLSAPASGSSSALISSPNQQRAGPATSISRVPFLRTLMLVHGYCSSGSIWPAADFTQPKLEFLDPNANRTHDQFAQRLLQAGSARNSFGIVGHSQGGPAALHLLTYYTSGLDFAFGGRRIQSVASPYQGTPLASLGFFACGVNNDMTPAGSTTWLAGIPTWARAEVWYWTTSDNGSACNALTGLILTNPEDGTVEQFRGQLPGAHSMGHVVGWCHTTGMSYPANYTDHARNAVINTNAAR